MGAHISNISAHFRITLIQKKKKPSQQCQAFWVAYLFNAAYGVEFSNAGGSEGYVYIASEGCSTGML